MRLYSRNKTATKDPLFTSLKDRLGVLLLLLVVALYWMVGWNFGKVGTKPVGFEETILKKTPDHTPYNERLRKSPQGSKSARPNNYMNRSDKRYSLANKPHEKSDFPNTRWPVRHFKKPVKHAHATVLLNQADSAGWEGLPGIGPVLALRIIKYREKLGGFYSLDQLREVYGLADSVIERIVPFVQLDSSSLQKLDINKASLDELRRHPYLKWENARAIIRYREAHGLFQTMEELKNIWNLAPETLKKIAPYLTLYTDSTSPYQH